MSLYIHSILWDLNIPQEAATITYEDNDACNAMANAQKPTPRTLHMDIKYFALCDWVEQDLLILKRIGTNINLADPFKKTLPCASFHHCVDFILGHVPPWYSPIYSQLIGTYTDRHSDIDEYVPGSFHDSFMCSRCLHTCTQLGGLPWESVGPCPLAWVVQSSPTFWIVGGCYHIGSRIST
jgi:hypothetical protein